MNYKSSRQRTRDLLLEYDKTIMPLHPRAAGLQMVYPWEMYGHSSSEGTGEFTLEALANGLYELARLSGFQGTQNFFFNNFGRYIQDKEVNFLHQNEFPEQGHEDQLYFDLDEKILYYWDTNQYVPVNAMLVADAILEGGER